MASDIDSHHDDSTTISNLDSLLRIEWFALQVSSLYERKGRSETQELLF